MYDTLIISLDPIPQTIDFEGNDTLTSVDVDVGLPLVLASSSSDRETLGERPVINAKCKIFQ